LKGPVRSDKTVLGRPSIDGGEAAHRVEPTFQVGFGGPRGFRAGDRFDALATGLLGQDVAGQACRAEEQIRQREEDTGSDPDVYLGARTSPGSDAQRGRQDGRGSYCRYGSHVVSFLSSDYILSAQTSQLGAASARVRANFGVGGFDRLLVKLVEPGSVEFAKNVLDDPVFAGVVT